MKRFICSMMLILSLLLAGCGDRYIDDRAGLMSTQEQMRLHSFQKKLEDELDIELQVVVLSDSPGDLDQAAVALFEKREIGRRTKGARGVLLLIDPAGKQVRMEIGYDLEGIFPDAFVGYVEQRQMAPFFAAGRIGAGIEATVELVVGKAMEAVDAGAYAPDDAAGGLAHLSGGAGARTSAGIGEGVAKKQPLEDASGFGAQPSPRETLALYLQVLRERVKDPELGIYTPDTRAFFRKWLVTDAQQDNEFRSLEKHLARGRIFKRDNRAVIRFPVSEREIPPYFLVRGEEGWMLDFASMNRVIAFNHRNQWHFQTCEHPFMFAFEDWRFDRGGFPHEER